MYKTESEQKLLCGSGSSDPCSGLTQRAGAGGGSRKEAGDVCAHIADPSHCTAETNNTVKQLYPNK